MAEFETKGESPTKEIFFRSTGYGSEIQKHGRHQGMKMNAADEQFYMTFNIPHDFSSIIELVLRWFLSSTTAGVDIDISSEYCANGELYNIHSESDLTSTYDFVVNEMLETDISSIFTSVEAGDECGLLVKLKDAEITLVSTGVRLRYS